MNTVCHTYDSILATLGEIADCEDAAKGLLSQVRTFRFILILVIFDRILSCTKQLSDLLQSQQCDLAKAVDLVTATIQTLEEFRSDASRSHLFSYVQQVAELNEISVTECQQRRQRRLPSRFEEGVILESVGSRKSVCTSNEYKLDIYFPILDSFLAEIQERFNSQNVEIMKAIQACNPQSSTFLDATSLKPLTENYDLNHASLSIEAKLAKRTLASDVQNLETISDVIKSVYPLRQAFPTLLKLLHITLTICVTSAQCERCFSALKRIKTYPRSTMTEQTSRFSYPLY